MVYTVSCYTLYNSLIHAELFYYVYLYDPHATLMHPLLHPYTYTSIIYIYPLINTPAYTPHDITYTHVYARTPPLVIYTYTLTYIHTPYITPIHPYLQAARIWNGGSVTAQS